MFGFIHRKASAARTLAALCRAAEAESRRDGQAEPGAEHFVLAALSLPDGIAARAFASLGATEGQLRAAIAQQYREPLLALGIDALLVADPLSEPRRPGLYRAAPSGQALVQALASSGAPLTSGQVLVAAAEQSEGVFARALAVIGLEPDQLRRAAQSA